MKPLFISILAALAVCCSSAEPEAGRVEETVQVEIHDSIRQIESSEIDTIPSIDTTAVNEPEVGGSSKGVQQSAQFNDSVDPRVQRILDEKLLKDVKDSINKSNSEK